MNKRETKGSRKAALINGSTRYFTGLPCAYGHIAERQTTNGSCIVCLKEYAKINSQAMRDNVRRCESKNIFKKKTRIQAWAKANPHKRNAIEARRRIAKINRTPKWLTEDDHWVIEQAYELASMRAVLFGFSWHVDHIIPLQGTNVSGLHVPNNIQVIPGVINLRKTNKYEVAL